MTPGLAPISVTWLWDWVPGPGLGPGADAEWTERTSADFARWTREGLTAVRAAWEREQETAPTPAEFSITDDVVGQSTTAWLLARRDQLPPWSRLAWGAAFVDEMPRWAPVPVVVEFREPRQTESHYLMDEVGAQGPPGDGREPVVDYVSTPRGDGVRVTAMLRGEYGRAAGRLDAAMRIEVPHVESPLTADVLFSTRIFDLGLLGVIGQGVELLMHQVAADCVPEADGVAPRLTLITTERSTP
ncbi:MAG: hypothetical protein ACRCSN_22590 [Dermatophilaceae bacterium]